MGRVGMARGHDMEWSRRRLGEGGEGVQNTDRRVTSKLGWRGALDEK